MAEQPDPNALQKGKGVAEQRTPVAEQQLRMVPMIASPALVSEEEEKKNKQRKIMEERVKGLRSLDIQSIMCQLKKNFIQLLQYLF